MATIINSSEELEIGTDRTTVGGTPTVVQYLWGEKDENGKKHYPCHRMQGLAVASEARYTAAISGVNSGKTSCGPLWLMRRIEAYLDKWKKEHSNLELNPPKDYEAMICAPTYKLLRDGGIKQLLSVFTGSHLEGEHLKSAGVYKLPKNFGVIYLVSTDVPKSMLSKQCDDVWMDESGSMPQATWHEVQQRVSGKHGRVFMTTTAMEMNWLKTEFADLADAGNPNYAVYSWPSYQNPGFDIASYIEAKDVLPKSLFKMRFEGGFAKQENQVYSNFSNENIKNIAYMPNEPLVICSDFGVSPMAWCISQSIGNEVYVLDEIYIEDNATTPSTLNQLWTTWGHHKGGWAFYGDFAGKQRNSSAARSDYQHILQDERFQETLRTVHYPTKNPDRIDRFNAMQGKLCSASGKRTLFINSRCIKLIEDFRFCYYIPGTRELYKRDKSRGHSTDGLGYYIYARFPVGGQAAPFKSNIEIRMR